MTAQRFETSFPETGEGQAEARARNKVRRLWQSGDLFHVSLRYPRRQGAPNIDRLAGILRNGLIAPGCCEDGSVVSDLHLLVVGCEPSYDRLIFLHRFGQPSWLYTICERGRFAVYVDPAFPVKTPEEMGADWPELSQDEVYVQGRIGPEHFIGIAIHPADADAILSELASEFQRLAIPLYDYGGQVLWPS